MQLPCAWFEQIVATLDAPATESATYAPAPGEQRRREPRVGVRAAVTLIPLTDADGLGSRPLSVQVRDLSAGGIGFFLSRKIGLDTQFVALLPHRNEAVAVLCRVAYYQPLGERLFAVGAEFVRVLRQPTGDITDPTRAIPAPEGAPLRRVAS